MQGRAGSWQIKQGEHAVKGRRACKKAHTQMKTGTTREAEEGTPVAKARYVGQGRQWTAQSKQAEQSTQGRHAGRGTAMQAHRTSQRNATEASTQNGVYVGVGRPRRQVGQGKSSQGRLASESRLTSREGTSGQGKQAAFPLHERTSMLGYTYIACLVVLYLNYW